MRDDVTLDRFAIAWSHPSNKPKASMTKIEAVRQWGGALVAFIIVLLNYGHADAATQIAFAMPVCLFFVCMAAYSTRKRIAGLQAQVDELRKSMGSGEPTGDL